MRLVGHGLDAASIMEIKRQIEIADLHWVEQFCTEAEQLQAKPHPYEYRYYAGRFAGKEAVVKALGTGFAGNITWQGIEILNNERGTPYVRLSTDVESFANSLGIVNWFISITYVGDLAIASAIAVAA